MASSTDTIFARSDAANNLGTSVKLEHNHITGPKPFQPFYFPSYTLNTGTQDLDIEERPSLGFAFVLGCQHFLAMFGLGTLLFFAVTGGRVPSYLGASAAFIQPVLTVTRFSGSFGDLNPNVGIAQGGIFVTGLVYAAIAVLVILFGSKYVKILMPPLVSGAVVMAIGLNLAGIGVSNAASSQDAPWQAAITILFIGAFSSFGPSFTKQIPILLGLLLSYIIAVIAGKVTGREINYKSLDEASWFSAPRFTVPIFEGHAIVTILPAVIVLLAENMGHVATIGSITNRNLDGYLGRAFLGDAAATCLSALGGGAGVTTYAENIGTMAVTRVYSTFIFPIAAILAIILSFFQKFGGVLRTIPNGIWGGIEIVVFGLIAITGARIWLQNRVDLSDPKNLFIAAVVVILGSGMPSLPGGVLHLGDGFQLDGIGLSAITAIVLNFAVFVVPALFERKS
ncbi:UNVERIFIED_CONTAM: hypothetical protein HDU68_007144 [Siphonaria sp. JEL0065]|nr:hypothetical protein HDU68_007144 [Siphonaria sp. JEL0065]